MKLGGIKMRSHLQREIKKFTSTDHRFAGELWPKWRLKLYITEPLTAYAGAVTGPWEIHRDCLQHMSYIIASICTPTTTCKLQMCTSPVISVKTERGGKGGLPAKNPKSFALLVFVLPTLFRSEKHTHTHRQRKRGKNALLSKHKN